MAQSSPASTDDTFDVVVVGSLNLDLVVRSPRHPTPGETLIGTEYSEVAGGKGLNQAVAAARSGARVAMVGAVGDDHAGEILRSVVRAEGIDDRWLVTLADQTTGRALITVDDHGENSIIVISGANAAVVFDHLPESRVVLSQLETGIDAVGQAFLLARERGSTTILNPAPAQSLPGEVLELCDVIIPNEHEVDLLGGRPILTARVPHVVVTLGADGADYMSNGTTVRIDPFEVEPVDTTGAGDAFCGSLASRVAAGESMADALRFAAAAGALSTTVRGAVPSQPHRADTMALLGS